MLIASGFSFWHLIPGVEDSSLFPFAVNADGHAGSYTFVSAWLSAFVIIAFAAAANMGLKRAMARDGLTKFEADESLNARTAAEVLVDALRGLMGDLMGKTDVKTFLPLIVGLFTYIFVSNLQALVPGLQPPTDNINSNLGMAVIVMVTYWVVGLTRDPKGFVGHILGPVLPLAPLMLVIELISLVLVRPASLAVRLTGNIFGDHTVFTIMSGLTYVVVPVIFLVLATLVSLIQAFVFSLLTTIYISQSLPHGDHADDSHH